MSRFQFVADHATTYQVKRLCEFVEIERSSYYAWRAGAPARAARAEADAQLAERIREIHQQDNTVGAPRVTAELNDDVAADQRVNHKRVARVMREHRIVGYRRRRTIRTTIPEPADHKVLTCWRGTSPPRLPTSVTSGTSPTCRWWTGATCTWPR